MLDPMMFEIAKQSRRQMEVFSRRGVSPYTLPCLACLCAISSSFLRRLARFFDMSDVELVYGFYGSKDHCWNEYKGYIIDITATQFDEPNPILIAEVGDRRYHRAVYVDSEVFFDEWNEQSPLMYDDYLDEHFEKAKERVTKRLLGREFQG